MKQVLINIPNQDLGVRVFYIDESMLNAGVTMAEAQKVFDDNREPIIREREEFFLGLKAKFLASEKTYEDYKKLQDVYNKLQEIEDIEQKIHREESHRAFDKKHERSYIEALKLMPPFTFISNACVRCGFKRYMESLYFLFTSDGQSKFRYIMQELKKMGVDDESILAYLQNCFENRPSEFIRKESGIFQTITKFKNVL